MKQAIIVFPELDLSDNLRKIQDKAEAILREDVAAAMEVANQPDQSPNSLGYTPLVIARAQIREAKRWFHSTAFGQVSVKIK